MVYSGGRYVNYRYNAEGSLAELDYGEGDAAPTATYRFEYDSLGRLIRSQQRDGNTVTQRTEQLYDTANRLSAQGWTIGGTSYRESYAYDASDGSLATLNTAVGTRIGYNYDALKRLRSRAVYQGSTPLFENRYAYATQSGNQSTALVEFFNYRLGSDDGNGDIIVGYQYEYDNGGSITDIKAEVDGALIPLEHYEYDEKQGQLKTAIRYENGEEVDRWTYSYDTAGNILSEDHEGTVSEVHEYAYEDGRWGDLLTSVDGIDLEYDGSGNPTLYANGTELLWNMEWQNGRQLSRAATERDSTTEDVLDFAYDANGIRTSKTYTVRSTAQIPEYTVTFKADGTTVKTMTVEDGYVLKDSDYPTVPAKSGYSGAWRKYTVAIHNDVTINTVYTALETKHTVIFFADGKALKTMQVDNGYTLQASDYPAIPPKEGYTSRWDTRVTRIVKDTAIYAIYSDSSTHTVTFIFAEVECGTLTVADGYILQDSDYPAPLVPSKDVSAVAVWEKYTSPIHEDITVRGNWQGSAVLPTEPSYPDEIMSGGEGEPVEADEPEENGAEPYSAGAMDEADTITHDYLTQSGRVARETIRQSVGGTVLKTETLDFFYDESGRPFAFNYSVDGGIASTYYYILNLQGDVVQIIDKTGVMQAEYVYSPWGEIISAEGDLAEVNPLRYRGYYYDSETGFYYLQSRYYDPENHRFINADSYSSTDSGDAIACNMFAYCRNNPAIAADENGEWLNIVVGAIVGAVVNTVSAVIQQKPIDEIIVSGVCGAVSGGLTAMGFGAAVGAVTSFVDSAYGNAKAVVRGESTIGEAIVGTAVDTAVGAAFGAMGAASTSEIATSRQVSDAAWNGVKTLLRETVHPAVKETAKKAINAAVRYSGKCLMSEVVSGDLTTAIAVGTSWYVADLENKIPAKVLELKTAANKVEIITELTSLLDERNKKSKNLK